MARGAITEYVRPLGRGARKRHYHETRRGRVVAFVVQLEVELRDAWVPVIRYDMAHGRAHIDLYETPSRKRRVSARDPAGWAVSTYDRITASSTRCSRSDSSTDTISSINLMTSAICQIGG